MTPARAATYIGGLSLLAAWLASAAGVQRQEAPERAAARWADAVRIEALASDVQSQAGRLRTRLATAPAPETNTRNPFAFGTAVRAVRPSSTTRRMPNPPPDLPVALPLELVGVAEQLTDGAVNRTAMIAGPGDQLFMVGEGQEVAGQYRVSAVGADAVELTDLVSGATRRLGLK